MKASLLFACLAAIPVALASCGKDDSPSAPNPVLLQAAADTTTNDCTNNFLGELSAVLSSWEISLETERGTEFLSSPPTFSGNTTTYLTALSPLLVEWKDSLNAWRGSDLLSSPPVFAQDMNAYLAALSPTLVTWEDSLEAWREHDFLQTAPLFVADTTAPTIACPADTTIDCAGTESTVSFTVTASDSCDSKPTVVCTPASGSVFPVGTTAVTCTATDADGNSSECTFNVTLGVDGTPPVIECPGDTTLACNGNGGVSYTFVVSAADSCDPAPVVVCVPPSGSAFPTGTTTVTCTATDAAGNAAECSFAVTVVDTVPPVIECPGDTTLECTGDGGATYNFVATASDSCDPAPVVVCVPPSGSAFPVGTTTVTCTATDAAGNAAACSFAVTVEDTVPPVIQEVSANVPKLWPPNHKMVEIAIEVTAEDACGSEINAWVDHVTSNESVNGRGDGNTAPDWDITDPLHVKLRSERSGGGSGRVYTLYIKASDASGNTVEASPLEIRVPHDSGHK